MSKAAESAKGELKANLRRPEQMLEEGRRVCEPAQELRATFAADGDELTTGFDETIWAEPHEIEQVIPA